jgi:glucose-1-phosphate cytidylyltransferase
MNESMKAVILCGGQGTRSFPFNQYLPKPMIPIGGTPVLVHVIKSFVTQGFTKIILAVGYRRSVLHDYFEGKQINAEIQIVDTGENSDTGDRVLACRDYLGSRFIVTYADGLCDVPLNKLVDFHVENQALATVTCVQMRSQYGVLSLATDGRVSEIEEKPLMRDHWINAGFIVLERRALDYWRTGSLERDVLPALSERRAVFGYRHKGFFKSVDTYKDVMEFEKLVETEGMPWMVET